MNRHFTLIAAVLLLAACGEPRHGDGLSGLDISELRTLADAGDAAATDELMRRAREAGEAEIADMQSAAASGDPKAVFQAAYLRGDTAAVEAMAAEGNIYALFARAMMKSASDDRAIAAEGRADAIRAAESGNADAALWVGRNMTQGLSGFDYQPAEGLRFVERAAEGGNAEAMFTAAQLHQFGAAPDIDKARAWYQRARDAGIAPAARALDELDAS